jgi:hypothetical protein
MKESIQIDDGRIPLAEWRNIQWQTEYLCMRLLTEFNWLAEFSRMKKALNDRLNAYAIKKIQLMAEFHLAEWKHSNDRLNAYAIDFESMN